MKKEIDMSAGNYYYTTISNSTRRRLNLGRHMDFAKTLISLNSMTPQYLEFRGTFRLRLRYVVH